MKSNLPPTPPEELPPIEINGRAYPMWSQFVHRKAEWIGGTLQDFGDSQDRRMGLAGPGGMTTKITDIELRANGSTSAWFEVTGENFTCGFDVTVGGIIGGDEGWLTLHGYGGHTWRIQKP